MSIIRNIIDYPVARKVVRIVLELVMRDSSLSPSPNPGQLSTEFQEDSSWEYETADKPVIIISQKIISHGTPVPFECDHWQYLLTTPTLQLST